MQKCIFGHINDMKEVSEEETGTTLGTRRHVHNLRRACTSFNITWDLLEKRQAGCNPTNNPC